MYYFGFEIVRALTMRNIIFFNMTPFSTVKVHRHFGEMYWLHLQGRRVSETINQYEADGIIFFLETSDFKLNVKNKLFFGRSKLCWTVLQKLIEVLTLVTVKITIFWDVTLYSLVDRYQCFEGTFCFHFHGRIDGGNRFLRYVGAYLPNYTASHLRRQKPLVLLKKCSSWKLYSYVLGMWLFITIIVYIYPPLERCSEFEIWTYHK
jgi:hypothetical protein